MTKQKSSEAGVIFNNPVLEFFSKTSPLITFTWVGLYVITLLWLNSIIKPEMHVSSVIIVYSTGLVFWTFSEYVLHRYLFHWVSELKAVKRFTFILHGIHHEYPRDVRRVFMPPVPGTIFVLVFFCIFWIFMRNFVFAFLPGFLTGYFIYAYIHYLIHAKRPFRRFKFWWSHHSLHHYKYPDKAFGVSTPIWDYVFRTMPPRSDQNP